jgi:hypothetical protein
MKFRRQYECTSVFWSVLILTRSCIFLLSLLRLISIFGRLVGGGIQMLRL